MTPPPRASVLAPFEVRSFRFQWPSDLATSWAFEMENLILGWYIFSTTGSVRQLAAFGALVWLGSIFSPFFGVAGDRVGHRTLLCLTRGAYALLAAILAALTLAGALQPWHVFGIAALAGLMRPSDLVMRNALVAQTMRPQALLGALGISRTTQDTARVAGALTGAGGVALIGMGPAYLLVTGLYVGAFLLSLGVAGAPAHERPTAHPLHELVEAFRYVRTRPALLGAFGIAFLANLLAFPFFLGLLPYVAKEVYAVGQTELGWLAASFAGGALAGSLAVAANRLVLRAARTMLVAGAAWFATTLLLGQTTHPITGLPLLFIAGFAQSFCLTPLAAVMLRASEEPMRGRVMGVRMLAIWGLPLGLVASGPAIDAMGYAATSAAFSVLGLALTALIAFRWQDALWKPSASANARL